MGTDIVVYLSCLFIQLRMSEALLIDKVALQPSVPIRGESLSIEISISPSSLSPSEFSVVLKLDNVNNANNLIAYDGSQPDGSRVTSNEPNLKLRSVTNGFIAFQFQSLAYTDDKRYRITVSNVKSITDSKDFTQTVESYAYPLKPSLKIEPNPTTENDANLRVNCQGNVGKGTNSVEGTIIMSKKPAGVNTYSIIPQEPQHIKSTVQNTDGTTSISKEIIVPVATYNMDQTVYRCQTSNNLVQNTEEKLEASVTLTVKYPVRDINISPYSAVYERGASIICSSSGNPSPDNKWERVSGQGTEFPSVNAGLLQIPENAAIGEYTYKCIASNIVNGNTVTKDQLHSFNVTAVPITTPAPTTTTPDVSPDTPGEIGDKDKINLYALIGGLVGAVVFIIIVILIVYFCCIKPKREAAYKEDSEKGKIANNNAPVGKYEIDMSDNFKPSTDPKYLNAENLMYADLEIDQNPRSRKPVLVIDDRVDYTEIRRV